MFRKRTDPNPTVPAPQPSPATALDRITSVLSAGINWTGNLGGSGGVRIEGTFEGDITAEHLEIRSTGKVWGNVVTSSFSTEEGAFLRGQITMEDKVEIIPAPPIESSPESAPVETS